MDTAPPGLPRSSSARQWRRCWESRASCGNPQAQDGSHPRGNDGATSCWCQNVHQISYHPTTPIWIFEQTNWLRFSSGIYYVGVSSFIHASLYHNYQLLIPVMLELMQGLWYHTWQVLWQGRQSARRNDAQEEGPWCIWTLYPWRPGPGPIGMKKMPRAGSEEWIWSIDTWIKFRRRGKVRMIIALQNTWFNIHGRIS